ncbi:MAG: DUF5057 domain-containing protein [Lachnospiraceae bacterium]|nr:DUF5057 domain-containing protein [Lachnospiraceae bacterium]
MKTNARVAVVLCGLLVLATAGFYRGRVSGATVYGTPETISFTKKNREAQLGSGENPFTILEIVPDASMAAVGYLIPGCEPVKQLETDTTGAMTQYKTIFAGVDGIASVTDEDMIVFRGDFPENLGFDGDTIASLTQTNTGDYFKQYGYFEHVEQGTYKYDAGSGQFLSVAADDPAEQITYQWVPLQNNEGGVLTDLVEDLASHLPENHSDVVIEETQIGTAADVVGSRYYVERCEDTYVCYSRSHITHSDTLVKTLFPGNSTEEGFVSQVITVTPEQLSGDNVEDGIIQEADMIVIHDSAVAQPINNQAALPNPPMSPVTFQADNDLSAECYEAIIRRQASGHPAMMWLDESAMDECVTNPSHTRPRYEIEKLYTIMNKYGAKYFYNVYCPDENGQRELDPDENGGQAFEYTGHTTGLHRGEFSYVLNWGGEDDFLSHAWDGATLSEMEHFYEDSQGGDYKKSLRILELQPISQYIYGNSGWKQYYLSLFPWFVGDSLRIEDDIEVTTMATYEFNGKIEDLNATYDLIIIGGSQDDTNGLHGYNDPDLGNVAYATVGDLVSTDHDYAYFIDLDFFAFNGNIGGGWGDFYRKNRLHWIADTLDAWGSIEGKDYNFLASENGSDISQCKIRYSATDITSKKYQELLDFSQKNPIVVDDKLYAADGTKVNKEFVDESSFIYNIATLGLGTGHKAQQVQKYSNVVAGGTEEFTQCLKYRTCEMEFLEDGTNTGENGQPVAYVVSDTTEKTVSWKGGTEVITDVIAGTKSNNQRDENGNPVLRYHFILHGQAGEQYRVRLYIDSNGNGAFDEEEGVEENLIISSEQGGTIANGNLVDGETYTVTRALPQTESGMLPWKLVVYGKENESHRDNALGYTRIMSGGQKDTIKVLQMDLSADMSDKTPSIRLDDTTSEVGAKLAAYLEEVEDYDVVIEYRSNEWFRNNYTGSSEKEAKWATDLQTYDMLVLGFDKDPVVPSFTNDEVFIDGFKKFVAAGKSVIMTHDLIQDKSFSTTPEWNISAENSAYLRNLGGQMEMYQWNDAKMSSYCEVYSRGKKVSLLPENVSMGYMHSRWLGIGTWNVSRSMTEEDYMYKVPGSNENICNLMDNSIRTMIFSSRLGNKIDRNIVSPANGNAAVDSSKLDWIDSCSTTTIKLANAGQITTYPYQLGDTLEVGETHAQNFRLNLETEEVGNLDFAVEGSYEDWDKVPHQETGYTEKVNTGAIVYLEDDKKAYGHVEIRDNNKNVPSSYRTFGINIADKNGNQISWWTNPFTVDSAGNITKNAQMDGMEKGKSYTYYFGSLGEQSTNIHNLFKSDYWEDAIFGKMVVTPKDDCVEIEYEFDVAEMVRWNNKYGGCNVDADNVVSVSANYSSLCANESEVYASGKTEQYVQRALSKAADAVVWYNLSNDSNDATNIYAAKDGDSANNYYLYTKGNVTYTGLGHSGTMTNDEIKLFVNTLISSYRSQAAAPFIKVVNEDAIHNGNVSTLYVQDRGEDSRDVTVQFLIGDDSIDTTSGKTYRLVITDEKGNTVLDTASPQKDEIVNLSVRAAEVKESAKTYTATLTSTYKSEGQTLTSESTTTVRVMFMPLFGLN